MLKYLVFILLIFNLPTIADNYNVYEPGNYNYNNQINQERILFIVDYSNSMNEKINGVKKMELALNSMSNILARLPDDIWIGFRAYGHKNSFSPNASCNASELMVNPGPNNRRKIEGSLYSLKATGWTPITYSLKQAVRSDFAGFAGKKRIILLTDGGENCHESPCDFAIELMKIRDDITIDVIAFDINDKEANDQLNCAALVTYGKFYKADTYAKLVNSLENSLNIKTDVKGTIVTPK